MINELVLEFLQVSTQVVNPAWFLLLSVSLAIAPLAICLLTSFVKLSIVLGLIKNALGTQHAPGVLVTMALSLSLTMLIMQSVINQSIESAATINLEKISKSSSSEIISILAPLTQPWKNFLQKNTGKNELASLQLALNPGASVETLTGDHPDNLIFLITAFLLSELKEAFCMAFLLLVPFLVIDLIVANILMGLGMMMLSPAIISLPIKLILFVVSDAWIVIAQALIRSYGT